MSDLVCVHCRQTFGYDEAYELDRLDSLDCPALRTVSEFEGIEYTHEPDHQFEPIDKFE